MLYQSAVRTIPCASWLIRQSPPARRRLARTSTAANAARRLAAACGLIGPSPRCTTCALPTVAAAGRWSRRAAGRPLVPRGSSIDNLNLENLLETYSSVVSVSSSFPLCSACIVYPSIFQTYPALETIFQSLSSPRKKSLISKSQPILVSRNCLINM